MNFDKTRAVFMCELILRLKQFHFQLGKSFKGKDEENQIEMKRHSIVGFRILNRFDETMDIARRVLDHHEHWDGTGYPKGIKQDEIDLLSRIIAVAEAYDFRTNPVRGSHMGALEAIEEIEALAGIHYDPSVVAAAKQVIEKEDRLV